MHSLKYFAWCAIAAVLRLAAAGMTLAMARVVWFTVRTRRAANAAEVEQLLARTSLLIAGKRRKGGGRHG